jgi:hypothetical protein
MFNSTYLPEQFANHELVFGKFSKPITFACPIDCHHLLNIIPANQLKTNLQADFMELNSLATFIYTKL